MTLYKKNAWTKWNISSGFLSFWCCKIKIPIAQWLKNQNGLFMIGDNSSTWKNEIQRELIDGPSLPSN